MLFIQPGGSLIFTTINRTPQSYLLAILGAEYVLNIVERGTHDWNKFIPDDELASLVIHSKCKLYIVYVDFDYRCFRVCSAISIVFSSVLDGFTVRAIQGLCYNPFTRNWSKFRDASVNYALVAKKEQMEKKNSENPGTT